MVGAILAGGAGRRMGGSKPARMLGGQPLLAYPAEALGAVCKPVAVVCKLGTELPAGAWEIWDDEPAEPRHPATGIAHALKRADGPVLVCAADMPFVGAGELAALMAAAKADPEASAVVARGDGLEPLLGVYAPAAAAPLRAAARDGLPLRRAIEALDPVLVDLPAAALRSVDTPDALVAAEREILSRGPGPR